MIAMFKPDAFVAFLAGGLIILVAMSILSGFLQLPEEVQEKNITTKSLTFSTNFSISNLKETAVIELGRRELINGLLFGSNSLVYNLTPKPEEAVLSFDVIRTNTYAPLVIAANGKTLKKERLVIGKYSFPLNVNDTFITIAPESSLWKIWAPALYELDNIRISTGSFKNETKEFGFEFEQVDNFQFGNIIVLMDVNEGRLFAELNGNVIYADAPVSGKAMPINKTFLDRGQNSIVFRADKNSRLAGNAIISITYASEN